jgi:hypothetical protein
MKRFSFSTMITCAFLCTGCIQGNPPVPTPKNQTDITTSAATTAAPAASQEPQEQAMASRISPPPKTSPITRTFTPDSGVILNPERGIYVNIDLLNTADNYASARQQKITLVYAGVSLYSFRNASLPESFLNDLNAGFQRAREAGIKVILRFDYNKDPDRGDAPLDRIKEHIAQLAPVLQKNSDVISVVQAGFIGAWGEWHGSSNNLDTPASRAAILDELLKAVPADRAIQVRTPMFKAEYLGNDLPLSDSQAFSGASTARLAHHNDCFLSSETDEGTYALPVSKWKDYMQQEGRFLPVGGETCRVEPSRTDCPGAMQELEKAHWSHLNILYHPDVIAAWKSQGCFTEIENRLGYRLQLLEAAWPQSVKPGETLQVALKLQNNGYAAMYNPRPVYLVLQNASSRYEVDTVIDPRHWEAGKTITETLGIKINRNVAPGVYDVFLWMPDAENRLRTRVEYAVRMANADVWRPETGMNQLSAQGATLTIGR